MAEEIDEDYLSDEMDDPEIEERWDKIQDLVLSMQKKGNAAVKKGLEEVKVGQRVLAWSDVNEGDESVDLSQSVVLTPATGTPDE